MKGTREDMPGPYHPQAAAPEVLATLMAMMLPVGGAVPYFGRTEIAHWLTKWAYKLTESERYMLRSMIDKGDYYA